jgi:RNA polymerase sigma-70 factor (ECF subfamily)
VISSEVLACIQESISYLPHMQQAVVSLRDIDGLSSEEVCNVLGLTETNQRVLLHRARSKLRGSLELFFEGKVDGT